MPSEEDRVMVAGDRCTQNFAWIGPAVPEICSRTGRQTDAQTDGLIAILRTPTGAE